MMNIQNLTMQSFVTSVYYALHGLVDQVTYEEGRIQIKHTLTLILLP